MSLEQKFAELSVGDEVSIVETIKAEGSTKSGYADNLEALKAKCVSSTEAEALAGLTTVKAIAEGCPEAEIFNKECLTACESLAAVVVVALFVRCGPFGFVWLRVCLDHEWALAHAHTLFNETE